jgi:hypothetical protein
MKYAVKVGSVAMMCIPIFMKTGSGTQKLQGAIYMWDVVLVFVDNHYNKYSQLESQTIREAGRSSRSVSWLAAEFVGPEKGRSA